MRVALCAKKYYVSSRCLPKYMHTESIDSNFGMSLVSFSNIFAQISYIKIINYTDSLSAKLNNTIQTKQNAMKKTHSNSDRNKIYKGLFSVAEGFWAEIVQNLQFLLI